MQPLHRAYLELSRAWQSHIGWASYMEILDSKSDSSKRQEVEAASLLRPSPKLAQCYFCWILLVQQPQSPPTVKESSSRLYPLIQGGPKNLDGYLYSTTMSYRLVAALCRTLY